MSSASPRNAAQTVRGVCRLIRPGSSSDSEAPRCVLRRASAAPARHPRCVRRSRSHVRRRAGRFRHPRPSGSITVVTRCKPNSKRRDMAGAEPLEAQAGCPPWRGRIGRHPSRRLPSTAPVVRVGDQDLGVQPRRRAVAPQAQGDTVGGADPHRLEPNSADAPRQSARCVHVAAASKLCAPRAFRSRTPESFVLQFVSAVATSKRSILVAVQRRFESGSTPSPEPMRGPFSDRPAPRCVAGFLVIGADLLRPA